MPVSPSPLPDGRSQQKRELYLEALRHDPTLSMVYANVASLLKTPGETVVLPDGRTLSQRGLYLEALRHDPANSLAYNDLASC
jgi:ABC-type amino acid transport system permease subunit